MEQNWFFPPHQGIRLGDLANQIGAELLDIAALPAWGCRIVLDRATARSGSYKGRVLVEAPGTARHRG
jgi:hypothetical protein